MLKTNKQWIFIILLVIIAIIVFIKWREYYYKKASAYGHTYANSE